MDNKKKSYSENLQDELEPIWHPTEYDESDDIEDAKKIVDEHEQKKKHPPRFDGEAEQFVQDFLADKTLADNLEKLSKYYESERKRGT